MAYIFFPLYDNPPPTSRQTNSKDKHPKIPKGFFISPTESKLFIKFHYLLWYHTFLTSLFTTFYIPCAIDFIKSRFYLRAIFTVLLKTKLFCPKIEIKTIGIINRYRNIISHTTLTYNRMPIYTKWSFKAVSFRVMRSTILSIHFILIIFYVIAPFQEAVTVILIKNRSRSKTAHRLSSPSN